MPGSRKAVSECFEAISAVIPHALQHMHGDTVSISKVHKSLTMPTSAHQTNGESSLATTTNNNVRPIHICPHKTANVLDPNDRNSPFPMISVADALKMILDSLPRLLMMPVEVSGVNVPPFRASIKDGYAVKSSGSKGTYRVLEYISAGDPINENNLNEMECFKINTGAPVPTNCDAVIQVEDTKVLQKDGTGKEFEIEVLVDPFANLDIRAIGCDVHKGEPLFDDPIYPGSVAFKSILASVGKVSNLVSFLLFFYIFV